MAYAFRAGDVATLDRLRLEYAELTALGDPVEKLSGDSSCSQARPDCSALLDLADCAHDEAITPPARASDVSAIPLTRIPGLLAALRATDASLRAIDGPELPNLRRIADQIYNLGTPSKHFVGEAFTGLQEVEAAIATHASGSESAAGSPCVDVHALISRR